VTKKQIWNFYHKTGTKFIKYFQELFKNISFQPEACNTFWMMKIARYLIEGVGLRGQTKRVVRSATFSLKWKSSEFQKVKTLFFRKSLFSKNIVFKCFSKKHCFSEFIKKTLFFRKRFFKNIWEHKTLKLRVLVFFKLVCFQKTCFFRKQCFSKKHYLFKLFSKNIREHQTFESLILRNIKHWSWVIIGETKSCIRASWTSYNFETSKN